MGEITPSRYTVNAGWDDVPHLTEEQKRTGLASCEPHLREARSRGIPSLGRGAIYPIQWDQITYQPFKIPAHFKRGFGFDVGWNKTAAIFGAEDPDTNVIYAYAEYYRGEAVPVVHATGIKGYGEWIQGAIDPASRGRSQADGQRLLDLYEDQGLNLAIANNAVEAGIHEVYLMLATGRLKVSSMLSNFRGEYEGYHRDDNGKIVKKNDHLLDALRYMINTWPDIAATQPVERIVHDAASIADPVAGM